MRSSRQSDGTLGEVNSETELGRDIILEIEVQGAETFEKKSRAR